MKAVEPLMRTPIYSFAAPSAHSPSLSRCCLQWAGGLHGHRSTCAVPAVYPRPAAARYRLDAQDHGPVHRHGEPRPLR